MLAGRSPLFIVRTYRLAALAWPGHIVRDGNQEFFKFDMDITSLFWLHATSVDMEVLDLLPVSPLRPLATICSRYSILRGPREASGNRSVFFGLCCYFE